MPALYFPGEKVYRHVRGWDLRDVDIPSGRHRLRIGRQSDPRHLADINTPTTPL